MKIERSESNSNSYEITMPDGRQRTETKTRNRGYSVDFLEVFIAAMLGIIAYEAWNHRFNLNIPSYVWIALTVLILAIVAVLIWLMVFLTIIYREKEVKP